ncbi:MAG: hypothetical protein JWO78_1189 [Micavibrio sp.]|nr:hypothetical protein [Micavibrio sp.]
MRMTSRELMDRLGVPNELTPYETYPFTIYDAARGLTCSAEVRMGMDKDEIECEIQLVHDTPPVGKPSMELVIWFQIKHSGTTEWETKDARLKNAPIDRTLYNWEEKCCNFFGAVVRFLKMDQIPDMDDLIDDEFHSRERFGGGGAGGGKSPKIKPGQLLGMKKGGF